MTIIVLHPRHGAGHTITTMRRLADVTQRELASAVGVSVGTIRSWEDGVDEPPVQKLIMMFKVCGYTVAAISDKVLPGSIAPGTVDAVDS